MVTAAAAGSFNPTGGLGPVKKPTSTQVTSLSQLDPNDPNYGSALSYYHNNGSLAGWQNPGVAAYKPPSATSSPLSTPAGTPAAASPMAGIQANGSSAIVAPPRTTLADGLATVNASGILPTYTPVNYNPVNYNPVSGITNELGPDYFKSLEDAAIKSMNERYFGKGGLQENQTNTLNKRGLLGSGVEIGALRNLNKGFGSDLVDIESDIFQKRKESDQQVAFKNKEIEALNAGKAYEAAARNAEQQVAAEQANRQFQGFLSELGLNAAGQEAATATKFDTDIFGSAIEGRKNDRDFLANIQDQLNTALGNENIDKETRDYFESIFGTNMSDLFGAPSYSEWDAIRNS